MRPFNPDGSEWAADTSNLALRKIRDRVMDDLHAHEEKVSKGRLCKANNWSPMHSEDNPHGTATKYTADPVLAALKHSGEDQDRLLKSRWAEFCAKPRDEGPYREELIAEMRSQQVAERMAAGDQIEQALQTDDLVGPMDEVNEEPPKRKRGRPKGSKNKRKTEMVQAT